MSNPIFADAPGGPDNALLAHLGIELINAEVGHAVFEMEIGPHHLNRQDSLHGGVIATLLDVACGYAGLMTSDKEPMGNAVTIMLNISYLSKASTGRVRSTGTVTRSGRSIYFASGELRSETGELIATAQGSFKRSASTGRT